MQYLIKYILLIFIICAIAYIEQMYIRKNNNYRYKARDNMNANLFILRKTSWINILVISIILSIFSVEIGKTGVLVDRERYIYSFLYRYPAYYESLISMISAKTEPGFIFLNYLISIVTLNYYWLFFFVTFITSIINIYSIRKMTKSYFLVILLYLVSMYYFQGTYLLKQAIAVAIANVAFIYYLRDKKAHYVLAVTTATMFHASAVVMFPLYLLFKKVKSKIAYVVVFFGSLVFFVGFSQIMNAIVPKIPLLSSYLSLELLEFNSSEGSARAILKGLPFYLLTLVALIKRPQLLKVNAYTDLFILGSLLYSLSWISTYYMYWFFRVGWYLLMPTLLLIPNILETVKNVYEKAIILMIIILPMCLITMRQIYIILT